MDFLTSLRSVALLVALVIPGYVLRKKDMLGEGAQSSLVTLLLYITQPALMVSAFMKQRFEPALLVNMGIVFVLTALLIVGMFFVSKLCFAFAPKNDAKRACLSAGYLSNCGFMGIPVLQAFFPGNSEVIMYSAIFNAGFNFLVWTLGVYSITGNRMHISIRKGVLNPPTIATLAALPIFFLQLPFPAQIVSGVDFFGNMTTPIAMTVIGIRLAEINLKELFTTPLVYLSSAVKLIVSPLLTFAFLMVLGRVLPWGKPGGKLAYALSATVFVLMAMPSGSTLAMFSEMFGGDTKTAVKCILLSSLLSVITIPFLMLLSGFL
jgi:predicted permease